jgi:hypothetical protein
MAAIAGRVAMDAALPAMLLDATLACTPADTARLLSTGVMFYSLGKVLGGGLIDRVGGALTFTTTLLTVRKTPLFAPFVYKCIILPRQAPDKHWKTQKRSGVFLRRRSCKACARSAAASGACRCSGAENMRLLRHLYIKNGRFTKTGSG